MKTFAFLCLLSGLVPMLRAQENLPSEPLLERVPAFAQWTIITRNTVADENRDPAVEPSPAAASPTPEEGNTPGKDHPPDKPKPAAEAASEKKASIPVTERTTIVTKTKSLRHEQTTENGGEITERWCLPEIQITIQGAGQAIISLPGKAEDSSFVDYSATDFPDLDWISQRNFAGIKEVNNQECYVFRQKGKGSSKDSAPLWIACINTATRLPVSLQLGDETRTYKFGLAPTAMIKLPPGVAAKVEDWKKSVEQSILMPAKP